MSDHICPWWLGYFLLNPLRRFVQDPVSILSPYVREGMQVLDVGAGMGYFSLPLAKLVGKNGLVHCLDVQPQMLRHLEQRARRRGLRKRLMLHLVSGSDLNMKEYQQQIDFALAFAVVHEVPDKRAFFKALFAVLKKQGLFLFSEPKKRVSQKDFTDSLKLCVKAGFVIEKQPDIRATYSALLRK